MQRAIPTALLTAIQNLGLYYYKGAIGQPRQTTSLCDPLVLTNDKKQRHFAANQKTEIICLYKTGTVPSPLDDFIML
jgi:hypothetical protein